MNNTTTEQRDVKDIAKDIRARIKTIPGAVFSVSINRQWAKAKNDPQSIIYISGMVKLWGVHYNDPKEAESKMLLKYYIQDVADAYELELIEGMEYSRYTLVQKH